MKKLFVIGIVIIIGVTARAQTSPAQAVAQHIAQKMKDSLSLTEGQQQDIYRINMQLHQQKNALRASYHADGLGLRIQQVENTRDSLYQSVLPGDKYQLYKQKKINLVSNN